MRKMCPDRMGTKMSIPLDVYVHTGDDNNVHQIDESWINTLKHMKKVIRSSAPIC